MELNTLAFDWLSDKQPIFAAQEAWRDGSYAQSCIAYFHYQPKGPFAIACGAALLTEHVRKFRFSPEVVQRMGQMTDAKGRALLDESFLNYLQRMSLRVQVATPLEGSLLLPGEPLLMVRGPIAQVLLLESAFRLLIGHSSHWATRMAQLHWDKKRFKEEDTPSAPAYPFNPDGWKIRAAYIGGASTDEILESLKKKDHIWGDDEGLQMVWKESDLTDGADVFTQIRRLYKATEPLADVWLTEAQDKTASMSKTSMQIQKRAAATAETIKFTRFQNLYQAILLKGHPVLPATRRGYLRQRTLHQMAAFHKVGLESYPEPCHAILTLPPE